MAALPLIVPFGPVPLSTSSPKTCVQLLAPANQRLRVLGYKIFFSGAAATDTQIKTSLVQQTDAGAGGTTATPVKRERSLAETPQTTALVGPFTTQPTAGEIQDQSGIFPQGTLEPSFPSDGEGSIKVKGGERIGLTADQGTSSSTGISAYGHIVFEE